MTTSNAHHPTRLRRPRRPALLLVACIAAALTAAGLVRGADRPAGSELRASAEPPAPPAHARERDPLAREAKRAGCRLLKRDEERVAQQMALFKRFPRPTNPPVFGRIDERVVAPDGVHRRPPALKAVMHAMSHGAIAFQYHPGPPRKRMRALARLIDGPNAMLFENRTGMPYEVAATGWLSSITCRRWSAAALDALAAFRDERRFFQPQPR